MSHRPTFTDPTGEIGRGLVRPFDLADLFCGAGGTSSGAIEAVEALGYRPRVTGVNHWQRACETFMANHPGHRVLCTGVDDIRPRALYPPGVLKLLWASPECTHHSQARGGMPINDQSRATAWCVARFAEALLPPVILIENVPEFRTWGPIDPRTQRPIKRLKGRLFESYLQTFEALGYRRDYRVLVAADFGDPTTRKRLFIQFVRGARKIVWPDPTHGHGDRPWRTAREDVIDWSIPGRWIDEMKPQERYGGLPLSPKSLERITHGFVKFGLRRLRERGELSPFLVCHEHGGGVRDIDKPLSTVTTAKGGAFAVAEPFIVKLRGTNTAADIDAPAPTVTGSGNNLYLAEPFLTPALLPQNGGGVLRSVDEPAPTVSTKGAIALLEPYLVKYYGTAKAQSVDEPLDTVTTKDRHALVSPILAIEGDAYRVRYRYRMLRPHELAAAQGFRPGYQFAGNQTEQTKQIGNAVPRRMARALVAAVLTQKSDVSWLTHE